jgi:hypothetical protein
LENFSPEFEHFYSNYKEEKVDIYEQYQDLLCWQCGSNEKGKMIICKQEAVKGRKDAFSRNGYSALC